MPRSRPKTRRISVFVRQRPVTDSNAVDDTMGALAAGSTLFPPTSTQTSVYARAGAPLVDALFDGFDGCLMAYGRTGSGKTHTMIGRDGGQVSLVP